MSHSLSLHQLSVLDLNPLDLIRTAHAAGFSHVCLFTQGMDGSGFTFPLVTPGDMLRETKAALADSGIKVFNLEVFYIHPDVDVADYRAGLELGASLGGTRCTAIIGDPDVARATDNFAKFSELGLSVGVRPAIEFMAMSAANAIDAAARIATGAGYPDGSIALDALHLIRTGGSPADIVRLGNHRLGSIQICDGPLALPQTEHVAEAMGGRLLPGQGQFPLRDFVAALPEDCVISVETPNDAQRAGHPDAISWAKAMHRAASAVTGGAEKLG